MFNSVNKTQTLGILNTYIIFFIFLLAIMYLIIPYSNKLVYLTVPLSLFGILLAKEIFLDRIVYPFLLLFAFSIISIPTLNYTYEATRDALLYLSYVLSYLYVVRLVTSSLIEKLSYIFLILTSIIYGAIIIYGDTTQIIDISNSYSPFENVFISGISSIFVIFYLFRKQYFISFVFFLVCVLAFKKIVLLALIFIIFLYYTNLIDAIYKPKILVILSIIYLFAVHLFAYGYFDNYISDLFQLSANQVSMGRQTLYYDLFEYKSSLMSILFGNGAGFSSYFVSEISSFSGHLTNIHSDYLKIFLEFGLVFYILFLYLLFVSFSTNNFTKLLAIFLAILFLTDNFLIYAPFMFFFLVISSFFKNDAGIYNKRMK